MIKFIVSVLGLAFMLSGAIYIVIDDIKENEDCWFHLFLTILCLILVTIVVVGVLIPWFLAI